MKYHKNEFRLIKKSPLTPLFQRGDYILADLSREDFPPFGKGR